MKQTTSHLDPALQQLLRRPDIWRAQEAPGGTADGESTGFPGLDEQLPAGGWPRAALTELLPGRAGIGELRLLMPTLSRLSRGARWIAWIDPPYVPHAAGLHACGIDLSHTLVVHPRDAHERLWALEQALGAGTCAAVLGWPGALDAKASRRLQLAAESGGSLGFLFRDPESREAVSHAALRLALAPERGGLTLEAVKQRGGRPGTLAHLSAEELFAPGRRGATSPMLPAGTG
jgi:cell division inhibitor SulA/protein ImuA